MTTRSKSRVRVPPSSSSLSSASTSMAPPQARAQSRPPSAMHKPNALQRSGISDDTPDPQLRPATSSKPQDPENNIQVAIRCRRRSEREVNDASPIIVQIDGAKSQDISIETSVPTSSFGVVTLPPTRKYPFDAVFGPEASQELVYDEVVQPMLEEVLQGYNCTLFAYGQTGTGKTHTMQGDLIPTPMGNPSMQAGMIPRVLFRLFHELETSNADYSVKISYVELYNEELRDLLAPELAAPSGSTQPMAHGAGKETPVLKIFDDSSKKGVLIQGLEDCPVKDRADALALLTKGSQRRQIAATKFNDHSSRSHSIFTITVHVKETSSIGDDLLKVGKLNLVDLAGSENIGRSGAENKRAREAGMINQSLLTLGRVINALVDKSSHVPYRESKLTRLLQDSLGGRTKTCIIATISPARCNVEETLSTLDYALRAKSIRNKPEVNQRMTRNALLKEYVAEIDRLKADVMAAREKNGIFFSEENWNRINTEHELKVSEAEESRRQIEVIEGQLKAVREEFKQSISLLMKTDGELKETKDKLGHTEKEVERKDGELTAVKGALEEEIVVRQAHQKTELAINGVSTQLKKVVHDSLSDLSGVFDKLDRKSSVLDSNSKAVRTHGRSVLAESQSLVTGLETFAQTSSQNSKKIRQEMEQWQTRELEQLSKQSATAQDQLTKINTSLQAIRRQETISDDSVKALEQALKRAVVKIESDYKDWAGKLKASCQKICSQAEASSASSSAAAEKAFKSVGSLLETIVQESQVYIQQERQLLVDAKALSDEVTSAEICRLQEQNTLLTRLLESERLKSEKAKDQLISRISGLLGDFTAERDRSLRVAFEEMHNKNVIGEGEMERCGNENGERIVGVIRAGEDWNSSLARRGGESKRLRDGAFKALSSSQATFKSTLADIQKGVAGSSSTYHKDLKTQTDSLDAACGDALKHLSSVKRTRVTATNTLETEVQSGFANLQNGLNSTSKNIQSISTHISKEATTLSSTTQTYQSTTTAQISTLRQVTESLVEAGTREDRSTGDTPRKRTWQYQDQWELTKSRDVVLKEWRQRGASARHSETFLAEHLPLPDGDDQEVGTDEGDAAMREADEAEEVEEEVLAQSIASSASSSLTAASVTIRQKCFSPPPIPVPPVPAPVLKPVHKRTSSIPNKSGLPTLGTLTERPTNIFGGRRRIR